MSNIVIHLIVGKWRTPNHSNRKENDDSHEIKKEILGQVGKKNFSKQVGNNPDIGIDEDGLIILKGTGDHRKRPYYVTGISAEDYFILRFLPIADSDENEVQILTFYDLESHRSSMELVKIETLDNLFIIPNEEGIVFSLVNYLTEEYVRLAVRKPTDILVVFSDLKKAQ